MNIVSICAQLPPMVHFLIFTGVFIWEYALGKTKFGSTIGLIFEHPLTALWNGTKPKDVSGPK